MKQAVAMATMFTMLLAVGVTSLGNESIHQHPAYTDQEMRVQSDIKLIAPPSDRLLLAAPPSDEK